MKGPEKTAFEYENLKGAYTFDSMNHKSYLGIVKKVIFNENLVILNPHVGVNYDIKKGPYWVWKKDDLLLQISSLISPNPTTKENLDNFIEYYNKTNEEERIIKERENSEKLNQSNK